MTMDDVNRMHDEGVNFYSLTEKERKEVVKTILNDPVGRETAMRGAMIQENWNLFFQLSSTNTANHNLERGKADRLDQSVSDDQHFS